MNISLENLTRKTAFVLLAIGLFSPAAAQAGHGFGGGSRVRSGRPVINTQGSTMSSAQKTVSQITTQTNPGLTASSPTSFGLGQTLGGKSAVEPVIKKFGPGTTTIGASPVTTGQPGKNQPGKNQSGQNPNGQNPTGTTQSGSGTAASGDGSTGSSLLSSLLGSLGSMGGGSGGGDGGSSGGSSGSSSGGYADNSPAATTTQVAATIPAATTPAAQSVPAPTAAPGTTQLASFQTTAASAVPSAPAAASNVDLVLENVTLSQPATLVAGPAYQVQFRNQGTQPAGSFSVAILALVDGTSLEDAPRALVNVPGLAAGEAATVTLRLPQAATRMVSTASSTPTMFTRLVVGLDVEGTLPESDKTNNAAVIDRATLESAAR